MTTFLTCSAFFYLFLNVLVKSNAAKINCEQISVMDKNGLKKYNLKSTDAA